MTRKRSAYRPRTVAADPIAYAIAGTKPAPDAQRVRTHLARHSSLHAYAAGHAVERDISIFEGAMFLARELAKVGMGIELIDVCNSVEPVIRANRLRIAAGEDGQLGPDGHLLLRDLIDMHDLQVQSVPLSLYEICQRRAMSAAERRLAQERREEATA
jgi:hypothetical protein